MILHRSMYLRAVSAPPSGATDPASCSGFVPSYKPISSTVQNKKSKHVLEHPTFRMFRRSTNRLLCSPCPRRVKYRSVGQEQLEDKVDSRWN